MEKIIRQKSIQGKIFYWNRDFSYDEIPKKIRVVNIKASNKTFGICEGKINGHTKIN